MRWLMASVALLAVASASLTARAAPGDPVGAATKVVNRVTAEFEQAARNLATGDGVRQDEVIAVDVNSLGEIKLNDDTKLALGPGSRLKLDKFVYDPAKSGGAISVDLLKGAFRFITGKAAKPAYLIRSPNASISVRGTIFDVFVDAAGTMWLMLHEGAIEVCNLSGVCRVLSDPCSLLRIGGDGGLGEPGTLNRQQLGLDTDFATAFPFVVTPPDFDPVVRFTRASIETGSCANQQNDGPRLQRADAVPEFNPPSPPRIPPDQQPNGGTQNEETSTPPTPPLTGIPIYVRFDINVNATGDAPRVKEEGLVVGDRPEIIDNTQVFETISISQDWISESIDGRASFGMGLGFRLPGGLRFEVTGDRRHRTGVTIDGTDSTDIISPPLNFSTGRDLYLQTKERTDIDGGVFMANAFVDIPLAGPLSIYVGGGVGMVWTQFERENSTTIYAVGAGRRDLYVKTLKETDHDASLAAALAAGFSYQISNAVEVEFGYRFVHIGGAEGELEQAGTTSTLSIEDSNQHEIRIGVRLGAY